MSYYKNKYPLMNDVVIVAITEYPEKSQSIQCKLIDYDNIPGIILRTEITKKKKELEPKKIFKVDTNYPVTVIDVNTSDANNIKIDLSYIKLNDQEKLLQLEKFRIKQSIYSLVEEMADICSMDLNYVLKYTMWKFMENKKILEDLKGFYDEILENPETFVHYFSKECTGETEESSELSNNCKKYVKNLQSRITSLEESSSKNFSLIVFNSKDGLSNLETLQWCLTNNLNFEDTKCDIHFISPSKYLISSKSTIKSESAKNIEIVEKIIKENITSIMCKFEIDQLCKTVNKQYLLRKYFIPTE